MAKCICSEKQRGSGKPSIRCPAHPGYQPKPPPKPDQCGLTDEEFKRFQRACLNTFGALEADLPIGRHYRAAVVDMVLDADRLLMYGEFHRNENWKEFYDSKVKPILELEYKKRSPLEKMMKRIFPRPYYD